MMTTASAEGEALRFSAYQYSPAGLVYSDDQWADSNLGDVRRKLNEYMDYDRPSAAVRRGWEALCGRGPRSAEAADVDAAADYLVDDGPALG
eukprot:9810685-Alexandrium_andersonii.AAC.1